MAASLGGGPVNVTGTAQRLTSLLSLPTRVAIQDISIRAATANAGRIWIGSSASLTTTTNQIGFIDAGEAWGWHVVGQWLWTDDLWLIATVPGDDAYVSTIS